MTPSFFLAGSGQLQRVHSSGDHLTSKANTDTGTRPVAARDYYDMLGMKKDVI